MFSSGDGGLRLGVLGPLEVCRDDVPVLIEAPRQQALLIVLLLHANHVVSVDRLIDYLWGDHPPETARNTVQSLVLRLRRSLGAAAGGSPVLVTRASGYLIRVEPGRLDLLCFEQLVGEGRRAAEAGHLHAAADVLRQALALWRGPALAEVRDLAPFQAKAVRLEERRLAALTERIAADLALGRHGELVGELRALVAQHPLHERLWEQLMLALFRSGRRADALHAYREVYRLLDDELGVLPSAALQRLHQQMLDGGPALDVPVQTHKPVVASTDPRPLPGSTHPTSELITTEARRTNTKRQEGRLIRRLLGTGAVATLQGVICGLRGVGKVRLALSTLLVFAIAAAGPTILLRGQSPHDANERAQGRALSRVAPGANLIAYLAGHTEALEAIASSPNGRLLITGSDDQTAKLWNITDPRRPSTYATLKGHIDHVLAVAVSRDGLTAATASADHTVKLWDITDPSRPSLSSTLVGHQAPVHAVVFSPDGQSLATAANDHSVKLWDVTNPSRPVLENTLSDGTGGAWGLAFMPHTNVLAMGDDDHSVKLWDVSDLRIPRLQARLTGHAGRVWAVAFAADGRTLASASADNTVRLWNVTTPTQPRLTTILTGHGTYVWALAFTADGRVLAAAGDHTVLIWNLYQHPGPTIMTTLASSATNVWGLVFLPDGHTLATANGDHVAYLWRVD